MMLANVIEGTKKMKMHQKGFTVVEVLLAVIAVALIIGVGFYITKQDEDDSKKSVTTSSRDASDKDKLTTAAEKKQTADPKDDWKTYSGQGITFKYPAGYTVNTDSQGLIEVTSYATSAGGEATNLRCAGEGQGIPKCEVKVSIPVDGSTPGFFPKDSDLKTEAQKIIDSIKQ